MSPEAPREDYWTLVTALAVLLVTAVGLVAVFA